MLAPQELNPEIPKPAKASVRGLGELLLRPAPRRSARRSAAWKVQATGEEGDVGDVQEEGLAERLEAFPSDLRR